MVREAAASNLVKFAATIEQPYLKNDIMSIFKNLTQDDQDYVSILAVKDCAALGKLLEPQDCATELLPVIVKYAQDKSWRVRLMVADQLNKLCEAVGLDDKRTDLALPMLLDCLVDIIMSCAGDNGRLEVTRWAQFYEVTYDVVQDIQKIMSHSGVPTYVTHDRHVGTWLKLLRMLQEINPLRRETVTHVDDQSIGDRKLPFFLEHALGGIFSVLVEGAFCSGSLSVIQSLTIEIVRSIDEQVLSLNSWADIGYRVSLEDISVHIPLHRLLSMILERAIGQCYGETSLGVSCSGSLAAIHDDFFGHILKGCHPHGFSTFIMEHALRIKVFCAQVKAGMWRRNGDAVILSDLWYRSVRWSESGLLHDLFLLQCCAALAPANQYVNRILERFELSDYLSLNLERSNEYEPTLVQEMLTLIIQIVQERRFCGLTPIKCLQRDLVYRLSTSDATHSKLLKSLPGDLSKFDKLEEVLNEIAVYSKPSGMNEGMYTLQNLCWKELDLYHPCWDSNQLQAVEERYVKYCNEQTWTTQLPKWTKIYPPLHGIARIATCRTVLQIVRAVVVYAVCSEKSNASRAPHGVLVTALHLLSLSLDICFVHRGSGDRSFYEVNVIPFLALASEELSLSKYGDQSIVSLLVLLMKKCRKENDINLSSLIGSLLKKFAELQPELAQPECSFGIAHDVVLESASDIDKCKAIARQRQVAIMEKMRAQQSKFLVSIESTVDIGASDSKHGTELCDSDVRPKSQDATSVICSICREIDCETPVSYLVLLQNSRLLSFTNIGPPSWEQTFCSAKEPTSSAIKMTDGFGPSDCDGIYLSSCGHAVHQKCLDGHLSSNSYTSKIAFEGHSVDPRQGEFLCPVCQGLANSVLPALAADTKRSTPLVSTGSPSDAVGSSSLRFQEALSLLQSEAYVAGSREILQSLPLQPLVQTSANVDSVVRVLCGMYFPDKDKISESGRLSDSLILYDTIKFSLVSTEIAARSGKTSLKTNYSLDALYKELKSPNSFILALLLSIVQSSRTKNSVWLRGIQLFADSICSGTSAVKPPESPSVGGNMQEILEFSETELQCPDIQFLIRVSDPVLAHEAFSSLMWTLYCLPWPFLSCGESFLSLVHLFYVVTITQTIIITSCRKRQSTLTESGCSDSLVTDVYRIMGECEVAHKYFDSDYIGTSDIKHAIRSLSFPYLRRCALLWKLFHSSISGPFSDGNNILDGSSYSMGETIECGENITVELTEIEKLEKLFKIPSLDDILSDNIIRLVVPRWLHRFSKHFRSLKGVLYSRPAIPFKLMLLPLLYEDLLQRYMKQHCPDCGVVQEEPALCLLCGKLCSPSWKLCCRESKCQTHAMVCGTGTGVFLLLRKTEILLLRSGRQVPWPSPYLDEFGEADTDMSRGMPLFFNEERYAALTHMVASHGLDRSFRMLRQTTTGGYRIVT